MKTLVLKEYGIGRYSDVSPFPIGDLEIQLEGIPNYNGDFRFVGFCNGVKCAESTVNAAQNVVTIPRGKLTAGKFSCRVVHYVNGKEARIFKTEDLIITDLDASFYADPDMAQMRREIDALKAENVCMKEQIKTLQNDLKTANEEFGALEKRLTVLEENNDILNN